MSVLNDFEEVLIKIDAENWEFFFLGDLHVNLKPGITSANPIKLQHIFDIYGLDQLITEPDKGYYGFLLAYCLCYELTRQNC